MPSGHKKEATLAVRARYRDKWLVKITPVGMELRCDVSAELVRHVFFTFVRDDAIGLRIQPAVGVTLPIVNAVRDVLSPRHKHTVDGVTGFVFLNDVIHSSQQQRGGWLFPAEAPLQPSLQHFLVFVDKTIAGLDFFESLVTLDDYIEAVDAGRWPFLTVMPTFLHALIATGNLARAKELAAKQRAESVRITAERGYVQREADTLPYDQIISLKSLNSFPARAGFDMGKDCDPLETQQTQKSPLSP